MIVAAHELRKTYGKKRAVDGVSFEIGRGEIVAMLGPNGAGKTTTIEMLLGLRAPESGTATLFGDNAREVGVRRRLGATPQQSSFPETLRVREIAQFVAAQYPAAAGLDSILAAFDLKELAHRQAGGLSGGESRRLALALAFIGNPDLVVLDEPTTGLDVEARHRAWAHVREFATAGGTVLLSTHYIEEAQTLASRVLVLDSGRVAFDSSPQALRARIGTRRVVYDLDGRRIETMTADSDRFVRSLVETGAPFRNLSVTEASLEEAFLNLTGAAV
ncbi:MAG: ABC transporter ATP-binding protein [Candidatus Eremiobacteraeota bacterium]|nr:ABC transporter ATP-binding protein [Candidatus Eremiobacteraeota bacterium]